MERKGQESLASQSFDDIVLPVIDDDGLALQPAGRTASGDFLIQKLVSRLEGTCAGSPSQGNAQAICLEKLLGPRVYDISGECLPLAGSVDGVYRLCEPWRDFALCQHVGGLKLHRNTSLALGLCSFDGELMASAAGWSCHVYTDGSAKDGVAGWGATVVWQQLAAGATSLAGCFGARLQCDAGAAGHVGADTADALQAEQTGLLWAILWIIQAADWLLPLDFVQLHFDNTAAGWAAAGEGCFPHNSPLSSKLRGAAQLAQTLLRGRLRFGHVHAHEGHPWNELSDVLAKFTAGSELVGTINLAALPATVATHVQEICWDWAWLIPACAQREEFPLLQGRSLAWKECATGPEEKLQPSELVPVSWRACKVGVDVSMSLRVATLNIQSLLGKHRYMEEQFLAAGLDIIFLQETKDTSGYIESRCFLRVASHPDQHWGVAVWVRRQLTIQGARCNVQASQLAVVCSEPRLVCAVLKVENFRMLLGSCHVPQQKYGQAERARVLERLETVVRRYAGAGGIILGIDANARVPTHIGHATGDLQFGKDDEAGLEFAHFLNGLGLQLPATFSFIHDGDSATWKHASGSLSRIDFVAVGGDCRYTGLSSWISKSIDTLCSNEDHWPAVLQMQVVPRGRWQQECFVAKKKYDVRRMLTDEGRRTLKAELENCRRPSWDVGVDRHAAIIEEDLNDIMSRCFPRPKIGPRAQYISPAVWAARQRCLAIRQSTRRWNEGFKAFVLGITLRRWAHGGAEFQPWQRKTIVLRELFAAAIRYNTTWAKKRIRQDKQAALTQMLSGMQGLQGAQLLRHLKNFGLGGRAQRRGRPPEPAIQSAQGEILMGRLEHELAWTEFFGNMEGGEIIPTADFIDDVWSQQCDTGTVCEVDWDTVPKLWELEHAYLTVACGKASGLDSIPPELLKAAAPEAARLFFPLVMKSTLQVAQPLQWKGGLLYESYKKTGAADKLESYRSLYVASVPGKLFHRVLRSRLNQRTSEQLGGLHCGAKAGSSVSTPSLALHLLVRAAARNKRSAAVIYLDTKTAYYAIVRELALGNIYEDSFAIRLFERFRLSAEDLAELMDIVRAGGTVTEAGASQHLVEMVKNIYKDGWFVTRHSSGGRVCRTTKGSRPGSSWADLLFTYIYDRILAKVRTTAECEGYGVVLKWSGIKELWPRELDRAHELHCLDCTWADDTAAYTEHETADGLVGQAEAMMGELLDTCVQFGLQPNFKKNKTMAVFALRGKGSRKAAARLFAGNRQTFDVPSRLCDGYEVQLANGYVHLGTYLDRDGGMECEARRRVALAHASFDLLKRMVYQNKHLQMEARQQVFRGSVTASVFNLELWTPQLRGWETLRSGFLRLQRKMLVGTVPHECLIHLAEAEIQYRTGGMPLDIQARRKRLGFLKSLVCAGPEALWAVVQHEREWAQQLRSDVLWLSEHSRATWPGLSVATWPEWWHILSARGAWFKAQVRRAAERARHEWMRAEACVLFLSDAAKLRWGASWNAADRTPAALHWCMICRKQFATKSGFGAHLCRMHDRKAIYRQYVTGTRCEACGKEFHTERRLTTHLRWSDKCCGVLAALGRRRSEPAPGLKSWKRKLGDLVMLCPPERFAAAAEAQPDTNRIWCEVPALADARGAMLDWLIEYEGDSVAAITQNLLRMVQTFPLYEHEVRLVFEGLAADVYHVIHVDVIHVWRAVGTDAVEAEVQRLATEFHFGWIADVSASPLQAPEFAGSLLGEQLRDPSFWAGGAPGAKSQVPSAPDLQVTSDLDSLEPFRLSVTEWKEEEYYLSRRREILSSLQSQGNGTCRFTELLRAVQKLGLGESVSVSACARFWSSDFSLPLRELREACLHFN